MNGILKLQMRLTRTRRRPRFQPMSPFHHRIQRITHCFLLPQHSWQARQRRRKGPLFSSDLTGEAEPITLSRRQTCVLNNAASFFSAADVNLASLPIPPVDSTAERMSAGFIAAEMAGRSGSRSRSIRLLQSG